ncbi:MAG: hypothetical protein HY763_01730 [Planctomycetes bacterium]|nr:hypothetical protein [Planctomycetota bacterium]
MAEYVEGATRRFRACFYVEYRTTTWIAQLVSEVYQRRAQLGLVYGRDDAQAVDLADLLGRAGLRNVIVRSAESHYPGANLQAAYVLHAYAPPSLSAYLGSIADVAPQSAVAACRVYFAADDFANWRRAAGDCDELKAMEAFCASRACRYALIVRRAHPECALPSPGEFCCYHCDVCLAAPRGCSGDQVV